MRVDVPSLEILCPGASRGFFFPCKCSHKGVDSAREMLYGYNTMKACSSRVAAQKLGISLMTLQRYIAAKKITAPRLQKLGAIKIRLWTSRDVERVRRQMKAK
jgi:hypothetical protein